jgi:hypothetical protein
MNNLDIKKLKKLNGIFKLNFFSNLLRGSV